jgi:hypothetical protein
MLCMTAGLGLGNMDNSIPFTGQVSCDYNHDYNMKHHGPTQLDKPMQYCHEIPDIIKREH